MESNFWICHHPRVFKKGLVVVVPLFFSHLLDLRRHEQKAKLISSTAKQSNTHFEVNTFKACKSPTTRVVVSYLV